MYGDRQGLDAAAKAGNPWAQEWRFHLQLFDEDPSRLDADVTISLEYGSTQAGERDFPDELHKLTATRLAILEALRHLGQTNLKDLTLFLDRDRKNVSRDVSCLERLHLIHAHRRGKEKLLRAVGDKIEITL